MITLNIPTSRRCEFVDVTHRVQEAVTASKVKQGIVVCYVPHTTAAVTIQENADPDVTHDLAYKLADLIPQDDRGFQHGEGNSDAHLKSSLLGVSKTLLVDGGRLVLGTWQAIYFAEFDGPRHRKMMVQVMPAE
jgi:secondary thiamine-phosphate synthase enzyme